MKRALAAALIVSGCTGPTALPTTATSSSPSVAPSGRPSPSAAAASPVTGAASVAPATNPSTSPAASPTPAPSPTTAPVVAWTYSVNDFAVGYPDGWQVVRKDTVQPDSNVNQRVLLGNANGEEKSTHTVLVTSGPAPSGFTSAASIVAAEKSIRQSPDKIIGDLKNAAGEIWGYQYETTGFGRPTTLYVAYVLHKGLLYTVQVRADTGTPMANQSLDLLNSFKVR